MRVSSGSLLYWQLLVLAQLVNSSIQPSLSCLPHCSCARDEINCSGLGLVSFPPESCPGSTLRLSLNNMTVLNLRVLQDWTSLKKLILSNNRIKSLEGPELESHLVELDLSINHLQVLHAFVLTQLPFLQNLNLSHNNLHTISRQTFYLPSLHTLDLSFNNLQEQPLPELPQDLVHSFSKLRKLYLSHNRISRLLDGSLSQLPEIGLLDFSHNFIMDVEEGTLAGLNVSFIDLSYNTFRKIPNSALQRLKQVTTLVLDGLQADQLHPGAIHKVPVKFLSISHCNHLKYLHENSISSVGMLETLTINNNNKLVYFHPGAVTQVPSLVALDLTRNNLSSMEDMQPYIPSLRRLYLGGNSLKCHCGLRWLQSIIREKDSGFSVPDGDTLRCGSNKSLLRTQDLSAMRCPPYILPLLETSWAADLGTNISWPCKVVGNTRTNISWTLVDGSVIREGECSGRRCVQQGALLLTCLHPQDDGEYSCRAENTDGADTRTIKLTVKMLHIQIFPLTVADTFVTLSWNTSRSLARDFVLQVDSALPGSAPMEFGNIEVGLKMSSYTISDLDPSTTYTVHLALKKGQFTIVVSSTTVETKPKNYMDGLGIVTDYTSIIIVTAILVLVGGSCLVMSTVRLYKLRCMVEGDNLSTKPIISSGSEPSSIAGVSSLQEKTSIMEQLDHRGATHPRETKGEWRRTSEGVKGVSEEGRAIKEKDRSRLVENEILSPMEDVKTMESIT